jgi:predicted RNA-binding protein YlqC (UPF0109 family)
MIGYDAKKQEPYFCAAWKNAVALCVMLCRLYALNETQIIDHAEGFRRGIASNHGDIGHWLSKHGENMNTFRAAVKAALNNASEENMTQEQFNIMFINAMTEYNRNLAEQPPSDWARLNWEKMSAAGIFDGSAPRAPLTREQAATVYARAINK